jgi:23S rRNA G2069 N7-methylase RlmK/C1962 C5-methylase RlmI
MVPFPSFNIDIRLEWTMTAEEKTTAQAEMLANRLRKRYRHLSKWAKRTGTRAFRLYDRDIPEIPLVLDWYGSAISGALYERPYEKEEQLEDAWLLAMKAACAESLSITPDRVFLKHRKRQRGRSQYSKTGELCVTETTVEGGLVFKVNFSDYLDTGLFLDRRLMRAVVRGDSRAMRVLNLFSYTGSFSVYAAAGGAALTDSVDISNTYLAWARENFSLNGFSAALMRELDFFTDTLSANNRHALIRADVCSFLDRASAGGKIWDRIILDPPAFSNSKRMNGTLDLRRDYTGLVCRCFGLLSPGGKLYFSANARQFKTDAAKLEAELTARFPAARVRDLGSQTIDEDFRGRKTPGNFVIMH